MQNFGHTTSDFDREYLRNGQDIQNRKTNSSTAIPPALHEEGPVNFGPLITDVSTDPLKCTFLGYYISALRGYAPLNFYTRYRLTKPC